MISDERVAAILDYKIPILPTDCWQTKSIKNYKRQLLQIRMAHDETIAIEYEKEMNGKAETIHS